MWTHCETELWLRKILDMGDLKVARRLVSSRYEIAVTYEPGFYGASCSTFALATRDLWPFA